ALLWSLTAMSESERRLSRVPTADQHQVLAATDEAVWWVTLVDATLVRHHPQAYDAVMAAQTPAERKRVEGTLAGLRFVRNQIGGQTGLGRFIGPRGTGRSAEQAPITSWTWKLVPRPPLASLLPRGRAWEMTRYRAYQAHLAGHCVTEVFGDVTAFLELTAAKGTFVIDLAPAAHCQAGVIELRAPRLRTISTVAGRSRCGLPLSANRGICAGRRLSVEVGRAHEGGGDGEGPVARHPEPGGPRGGHGPAPRPRPGPVPQLDGGDLRRGRPGAARDAPPVGGARRPDRRAGRLRDDQR